MSKRVQAFVVNKETVCIKCFYETMKNYSEDYMHLAYAYYPPYNIKKVPGDCYCPKCNQYFGRPETKEYAKKISNIMKWRE